MTTSLKKQITSMFLEPILDPYSKTYCEVITLSNIPIGPLSPFVQRISSPKLSEFQGNSLRNKCIYVLLKSLCSYETNCCKYVNIDDISEVFSFLTSNNYVIEEGLSQMVTSQFNNHRRLICMFSYSE